MNAPRITQRDLARTLRLSVSAVSQALRNQPAIPQATRDRVRAAAQQLGYRPDPALSALVNYRHRRRKPSSGSVLAYVTAFPTRDGWKRFPFFRRTREGAAQRAEQLGYQLNDFWLEEPGISRERFCAVLEARGIRGFIIAPLPEPGSLDDLPWNRFSAVAIGPSLLGPRLHSACNNHYHAMLLALEHIHLHGYRRVGLVLDPRVDERHQQKYQAAFWHHTRRLNLPAINPLLTSEYEAAEIRRWWQREQPDAVLADDEAVLAKLERMELNAPRALGFACLSLDTRPGVAGVDTAPESIAGFAVERLAAMLARGETGIPEVPTSTMLNGRWVEGRTLRGGENNTDRAG